MAEARPDERAWRAALSAGLLLLACLYLAFPDKVYVFDGVMFAGVIERSVTEWRAELFNGRHLLFNPLLMGLRDLLARSGVVVPGYELMQRFNAVLGACGALLFLGLLRTLRVPRWTAAAGALLLAATFVYAGRATEGQAYMALTVAGLATLWAAVALVQAPSLGRGLVLGAALAVGCLFHAANIVLAAPAAVAFWLAGRRRRSVWAAVPAAALLLLAPFALVFKLSSWSDVVGFLGRTTEMRLAGAASTSALLGSAMSYHVMTPLARVETLLRELLSALAANRLPQAAAAALGALCLAGLGAAAWPALRDDRGREPALVLAMGALVGMAFTAYWQGGEYFWAAPVACALALALSRLKERSTVPVAAAAAALLAWNLGAGLLPRSKLSNNEGYRRAMFVRDHTSPSSWVVISGMGFPNQKVYLSYFAHRSREVLEYYFNRYDRAEALRRFTSFVQANEANGVPMYLLPDLVDDPHSLGELQRRWGITLRDLLPCFGPGRLIVMAQQDAGFRVYLFLPDAHLEPLFAVLSYSALTESDNQRLSETVEALRQAAAGMSPARRAGAARLLERSDYGGTLLLQGFGPFMDAEERAAARGRLARFAQYQESGNFHLRLGNLYKLLGQTALVRREWKKAYDASGDQGLAAQLRALR